MALPICLEIPEIPDPLAITLPGGVTIQQINLMEAIQPALTPLMPIFDIIDTVVAVFNCVKAIPDSLGPPPDPTALAACIPELAEKVAKLLRLIPQLSLPYTIIGIIDLVIDTLRQARSQLVHLRWDESGSAPDSSMQTAKPQKKARARTQCAAPVTPLASRDRARVIPTAKGRAGRRPRSGDAPAKDEKLADLSPLDCPLRQPHALERRNIAGAKERSAVRNVALDLGKKKTTYCEIADGKVVQRATVTRVESLSSLLGPDHPPATVAIEACREAWYVHDLLSGWGNRVLLVDTTRNKQIGVGRHGRKTDRIDAEVLARAVERGGIPVAHLLSPHRRELRRVLGIRRALVESRAQLVTTARGVARESGISLPGCTTENFSTRVRTLAKNEPLLCPLEPLLKTIDVVSAELVGVEAELARLCAAEPIIMHLCTVPGVGPIVAASFVSVVDDAKRFQRAHHLESYLGLVPNENSSGGKRRLGAITKKGNKYLRTVLVQAAWALLRKASPDDPLRRWTEAVAERRGKRVAVIALARKLSGVLWAIWRDAAVYDPDALAQRTARGLRTSARDTQLQAAALEAAASKRSLRRISREATTPAKT